MSLNSRLSIAKQYRRVIQDLVNWGFEVSPNGERTHETRGSGFFEIRDGAALSREGFNVDLARVEMLSILAGQTDREALCKVIEPEIYLKYFSNRNVEYAEFLGDSLWRLIDILRFDPSSRRAVAYIGCNGLFQEDMPCTMSYQLQIRAGVLMGTVNMRSWDIYRGVPYDIYMWSGITETIRRILSKDMPRVTESFVDFSTPSLHLYEKDKDMIYLCDPRDIDVDLEGLDFKSRSSVQRTSRELLEEMR